MEKIEYQKCAEIFAKQLMYSCPANKYNGDYLSFCNLPGKPPCKGWLLETDKAEQLALLHFPGRVNGKFITFHF